MNAYTQDILSQPEALRQALEHYSAADLAPLAQRIRQNEFDRILITGMGASYNAAYPAMLQLSALSIPVMLVTTAELLHYSPGLLGKRTLLWLNSQSGRSIELVRLLEQTKSTPPACILSCVNDTVSPLALAANVCLPIHAGVEATVSTRTYTNMLAIDLLAAITLVGGDPHATVEKLLTAADAMEAYLAAWQAHVDELDLLTKNVKDLVILGRGASLAAVWNGSLILKEAAKCAWEGMSAADFRHGPLELVSADLMVLVFAGAHKTAGLNHDLALEVIQLGGRAIWIGREPDPIVPSLCLPPADEIARPLVEILPLQLLSIVMAGRKGLEAGKFRHIQKITTHE